jgi:3-phenylpropionate/cinnamic acid dioxygenase small subunit
MNKTEIITAEEYRKLNKKNIVKKNENYDTLAWTNDNIAYIITKQLPTLNEYINAERTNRYKAAAMKKKATKICEQATIEISKLIDPKALYDVQINWQVINNRTDSDNLFFGCKFILDGLINSGALEDDNRKHIRNISHTIATAKVYQIEVNLIKVI